MSDPSDPLEPAEVAALLRATGAAVRAELSGLPRAAVRWHPAPDEWCVLEVLGHLIEAEQRGFAGRIRLMLDRDEPTFETWDQPKVARARRDCERDAARRVQHAPGGERRPRPRAAAGGSDPGRHTPSVGHLCVGDLLHEWIHHDRNHLKQMLANVQGFVWPHMGNAQRFSGAPSHRARD